jgi:hypothetical protein
LILARFARLPSVSPWLSLLGVVSVTLSCRSLDRFDTSGDAAFCGDLVSGPSFHDGFVAEGEPWNLRLKLDLDASKLSSFSENKNAIMGWLTSNDEGTGLCLDQPLFQSAPIRAIPQLYHDTLSTLSFGEGHDEDFFAYVDSTCQGTMVSLVSLLRNGNVEVRLFKPARLPDEGAKPDKRPGYAVFHLARNDEGCEFAKP